MLLNNIPHLHFPNSSRFLLLLLAAELLTVNSGREWKFSLFFRCNLLLSWAECVHGKMSNLKSISNAHSTASRRHWVKVNESIIARSTIEDDRKKLFASLRCRGESNAKKKSMIWKLKVAEVNKKNDCQQCQHTNTCRFAATAADNWMCNAKLTRSSINYGSFDRTGMCVFSVSRVGHCWMLWCS